MSWWHLANGADDSEPRGEGADDVGRLLALLEADTAAVSVADLQARGVRAPAQAVYELQLAGYGVDRVYCTDTDGLAALGYRLQPAFSGTGAAVAGASGVVAGASGVVAGASAAVAGGPAAHAWATGAPAAADALARDAPATGAPAGRRPAPLTR